MTRASKQVPIPRGSDPERVDRPVDVDPAAELQARPARSQGAPEELAAGVVGDLDRPLPLGPVEGAGAVVADRPGQPRWAAVAPRAGVAFEVEDQEVARLR